MALRAPARQIDRVARAASDLCAAVDAGTCMTEGRRCRPLPHKRETS